TDDGMPFLMFDMIRPPMSPIAETIRPPRPENRPTMPLIMEPTVLIAADRAWEKTPEIRVTMPAIAEPIRPGSPEQNDTTAGPPGRRAGGAPAKARADVGPHRRRRHDRPRQRGLDRPADGRAETHQGGADPARQLREREHEGAERRQQGDTDGGHRHDEHVDQ